ncbi:MAG: hypothetical protein KGL54_02780 [Sphingomonadales bacterium]|nr:hypothetical protein [Sphingomonadales bacterium]
MSGFPRWPAATLVALVGLGGVVALDRGLVTALASPPGFVLLLGGLGLALIAVVRLVRWQVSERR